MNNSLKKRIKITGTGKILKRKPGQNHFRARKSGSKKMGLRKEKQAPNVLKKFVKPR